MKMNQRPVPVIHYGNSSMYYASGHINGTLGIYTIGINNRTGIIYHRCFYSMDRISDFKFPR